MVADMEIGKVTDMEVDQVADMVTHIVGDIKNIGPHEVGHGGRQGG